ncbi:MAG: SRPBCC domain-containing protein [Burkholderiales bacterium]|nr:SRPBCC domain-containing protein [Burkholderiales bacterium]
MDKLYVERSIEIHVRPSRVWEILTEPEWTSRWAVEFGATGPIDSNWKLGSDVLWRNAQGEVYVDGKVTAVARGRLLRFTVRDVLNPELRPASGLADDDITQTYSLVGDAGRTVLSTAHGDFAKLVGGEQLDPFVVSLWGRLLPKVKELAERGQTAV